MVPSLVVVGAVGFFAAFASAVGCANSAIGRAAAGREHDSAGRRRRLERQNPLPPSTKKEAGASSGSSGSVGDDDDTTGDDDDNLGGPDGGTDSGHDAGPPPPPAPNEGDPCTQQDEVRKVACGFCGTRETTVCEKKADGSLGWSGFSPCDGEHGVCAAGSVATEECNNCGTRTVTCTSSCTWTTGTCSAAANTGCSPLTYDITNAGCGGSNLGLYRVRQCKATCDYESYSGCSAPPTSIEVGRTVGAVSSTVAQLGGSIMKVSSNVCPATLGTVGTAYAYTQIHNPLPTEVTVIVYNSLAPAGKVMNTAIAVYAGDVAPTTVDARKACLKSSNIGNGHVQR